MRSSVSMTPRHILFRLDSSFAGRLVRGPMLYVINGWLASGVPEGVTIISSIEVIAEHEVHQTVWTGNPQRLVGDAL